MNRRGFVATVLGILAAPLGIFCSRQDIRLWFVDGDKRTEIKPLEVKYSVKPFLRWQRQEIARIFAVPAELLGDVKPRTFEVRFKGKIK